MVSVSLRRIKDHGENAQKKRKGRLGAPPFPRLFQLTSLITSHQDKLREGTKMSHPKSKSITKFWHGKLIEYDASLTDEQFLLKHYTFLMRTRLRKQEELKQSRIDEAKAITPQN